MFNSNFKSVLLFNLSNSKVPTMRKYPMKYLVLYRFVLRKIMTLSGMDVFAGEEDNAKVTTDVLYDYNAH